jgi:hypothetical protein
VRIFFSGGHRIYVFKGFWLTVPQPAIKLRLGVVAEGLTEPTTLCYN